MSEPLELAGRGRRLAATLIDAFVVPFVTIVLVMITNVMEDAEDYTSNLWMLWTLLLAIASYVLVNGYGLWRRGQTLGKRLLGIAIVPMTPLTGNAQGQVPLWKLLILRAPFFALMFLIIMPWVALVPLLDHLLIFRRSRRCLHDHIAGTQVVRRRATVST